MKEAADFAAHLRRCEKAISDMKVAGDAILTTTKATMTAPLPHVFEETAAGAGGDVRPTISIGGSNFQGDAVIRLSQTASAQIESQVLVPIKRWLEVFNALQLRMKEVEALRLEVDSRRHTVIDLAATVDKHRARLSRVHGSDHRLETTLDETIKKLQHKEGKLTLAVQSFQEKEQALSGDLATLIKDATWLRHYMSSALRVQGEALLGASKALGDSRALDSAIDISTLSLNSHETSASQGARRSSSNTPTVMETAGAPNPFIASGVISN